MQVYIKSKQAKSLYIIYSILSISLLNLIIINNAFAENVDYSVTVQPSLSVTTSVSDITLNLNPATNPFDSQNLTVSVGTNNQTGYKLYVSTPNNTTNLVEQNDSNLYIETLGSEVSENNFTPNRWGYKLNSSSTNYAPFESGILVNSSDSPTEELVSTTMTFGAKADYDTKAGTYNLALNFQATANPLTPIMQNLDASLCTTTPTTVIDGRDDQEYIIQRLKDGKCWMMTNLNLGATNSLQVNQLDSSNTNFTGVNISKTIAASTFLGSTWKKTSGTATFTSPEYIPITNINSATGSEIDPISDTKYGVLYNYCAASAQTYCYDSSTNGGDADSDLCPAGWRLPTSGSSSGEFQALYSYYNSYNEMRSSVANNGVAFNLAGFFYNSTPTRQGASGCYLSPTWRSNSGMYYLFLVDSSVRPAHSDSRSYGNSIRCILK